MMDENKVQLQYYIYRLARSRRVFGSQRSFFTYERSAVNVGEGC